MVFQISGDILYRPLKIVNDGQQLQQHAVPGILKALFALALHALAVVGELRPGALPAVQVLGGLRARLFQLSHQVEHLRFRGGAALRRGSLLLGRVGGSLLCLGGGFLYWLTFGHGSAPSGE